MTVETDTSRVQYATKGTTGPWSVPFYFLADADLRVVYADSSGVETELTLTTDYSVTGAADPAGGSVTTVSSYTAGGTITVVRSVDALQPTDYSDTDAFPAASLERNLDRLTMLAQQQAEVSARSIVLPVSDESSVTIPSAADRASRLLGFDASGDLALVAPTRGSAADLALDLASRSLSTKNAGQVGSLWTLNYAAGTVGNDLRYGSIQSIFKVLSAAQQADVLAYTFTLDLYATIAAALLLCKTWYFPSGGYKLTDELTISTGFRIVGDSNADRFYGAQPTTGAPTRFWQATSGKACFKIGVGVSDVVMSDFCMSAVQTPGAYTAYTAGKYGIKMEGANYVAAGTAIQIAGRSSYRITLQRLSGYQFERFISCADYYWDLGGAPPNSGSDWQCDSVDVLQCHSFSCLHHTYVNTTNADAWNHRGNTAAIWTNGFGLYLERSGYHVAETCYWVPAEATAGVLATGTTGVFASDWPDNITLIGCSGSDSLAYFLDVDTTAGYANVYNTINLEGCAVEAPCRIRRTTKLISKATRYTHDVTCSGDDIEVHSIADSWSPTTTKFLMTGLRPRLFVHGGSTQTTSSTASVATATATTVFTLPASAGAYQVFVWLTAGGSTYQSFATLMCDGTTLARIGGTNGANMTITVSGRNVQVTQSSGVSQTVQWSYVRLA